VDSTGQITDTYNYTPYGKLVSHDGSSENSFLFTGEQLDNETGNYSSEPDTTAPNWHGS